MAKKAKKKAKKTTKKAGTKKAGTKKASTKKTAKKASKKKARRTVLYSSKGKKLYAKRNADGTFNDIQQYSKAHAADIKRDSADGN